MTNFKELNPPNELPEVSSTPSVTIAVSAYNEEKNILDFLNSVVSQREDGYKLEKILVISDGSTDRTAEIAKTVSHPKLEIRDYSQRVGKSTRLNEIYSTLGSELLVQSDADVIFDHPYVVSDMIRPLKANKTVAMTGGHSIPSVPQTFTEKAVYCTAEMYIALRGRIRGGNNYLNANGSLLAYKREFLKQVTVPKDMLSNDMYTYLRCLESGYRFQYAPSAVVTFRLPQTLRDQIKQNTRFSHAPERLRQYFPDELVDYAYFAPKNLVLKSMLKEFIRHPVLSSYIFWVNQYCKIKAGLTGKFITARWAMVATTKKPR